MFTQGVKKLAFILVAAFAVGSSAGCLVQPGSQDPADDATPVPVTPFDGGVIEPDPHPWQVFGTRDWSGASQVSTPVTPIGPSPHGGASQKSY